MHNAEEEYEGNKKDKVKDIFKDPLNEYICEAKKTFLVIKAVFMTVILVYS